MIEKRDSMTSPQKSSAIHPIEWSKKAIASVILSSIGFVTLWLIVGLFLSALGAVLGHLAKQDIRDHAYRGRRLATLGLGLSYGSMLLFPFLAILVAVSFPAMSKWRSGQDADLHSLGRANGARLFIACEEYARANRDHYPEEWEELSGRYLPSGELASLLKSPYPGGKRVAFELVKHDRPVLEAISDSVIVIQEIAPSGISEITVVSADGTVSSLHNPDYEKP
jgi:MFS family permease